MRMKTKTYVLICFIGIVLAAYAAFLYHVKNIKVETFPPSNISSEFYKNESVKAEYIDCLIMENSLTNLELQQCKLRASKSWFTQSLEEANCAVSQAKAAELACEAIIAPYRKK
jgi:hypothetical protein